MHTKWLKNFKLKVILKLYVINYWVLMSICKCLNTYEMNE